MIVEALILGASVVGCMGCWATVIKHKLNVELQKHKIDADYEVLKPVPEPIRATVQPAPSPMQQSLTALLFRREKLEHQITEIRTRVSGYPDKSYTQYRTDALTTLEDARKEQQELVSEEVNLLEMMQGVKKDVKVDASEKPVRVDSGGSLARLLDDSSELHDVELHDQEASREGSA